MKFKTKITKEDIRPVIEQYFDFSNTDMSPGTIRVAKRYFNCMVLKEVSWHMKQEENFDSEAGEYILGEWEYNLIIASILSVLREDPEMADEGINIKRHPSEKEFE